MDKEYAKYLLKKTQQDYNLIAKEFSSSREKVWEELTFLKELILVGEKVLDLGCGNGRFYELFKDKPLDYYGVDISENLITIAKSRYPGVKFKVIDGLNFPFPNNYFDKIYSIAVFHHIPSEEFRLRFLKEARRVLKPGGYFILTVWNLWKRKKGWKLLLKFALLKLIRKSRLDFGDVFLPWKNSQGKIIVQRYFHYFTKGELKKVVSQANFQIKKIGTFSRARGKENNIYLVIQKK